MAHYTKREFTRDADRIAQLAARSDDAAMCEAYRVLRDLEDRGIFGGKHVATMRSILNRHEDRADAKRNAA